MKQRYLEDLNYFLNCANQKRGKKLDKKFPNETIHLDFYFLHSKEELNDFIKKYENEHKINNDYDFYYFMKCLIKFMCGKLDAHTNISMKNNNNHYPISFLTIDNNIYIHKCNDPKYNLSELKEINGIKIEKIIDELERCINYGTYSWFLVKLDFGLSEKNTLLSLPSINSNTNTIEYKTSKEIIKYDINKDYTQDFSIFNIDKFEQLKIKDNMLIIKYPSCSSIYVPNIKEIKKIINKNNITNILLDLRGNTGGNSTLIKPLIRFLKHSKLNLTTLVDRYVFSSGRFAVIDMKKIGSKIVGEEIGTPINCFGYTSGNDITPNTNLKFNFAKVYWYQDIKTNTMKGIYTKKKLHTKSDDFFNPKYLGLDYHIKLTIDDFANKDYDVMLEKCYKWINSEKR